MEQLNIIGQHAIEIFTLVSGIIGSILSLLLLFSLNLTKKVSDVFNKTYNVDDHVQKLDRNIRTDTFFYSNNKISGMLILIGSVIFLAFLFFRLDPDKLIISLHLPHDYRTFSKVIILSMSLFGKICSIFGIISGLLLFISPEKFRKIETRLNHWIITQPIEERLNQQTKDIDTIFFLHPVLFGSIGLICSVFLTFLSIINIFKSM